MADYKKKEGRGEPTVEFRWNPLQLASDQTFSTAVRIYVSGWWPEGRPTEVSLSYYEKSQKPADGNLVRIQKGQGTFPLTGLEPGKHYHVVVYIEDRVPVHDMIMVPELPKPKSPEQEAFEGERAELERARVARELREIQPPAKKREIKILQIRRRPFRLEAILQRIGKEGKPEKGDISVLDFEQGGIVFGDASGDFPFVIKNWGIVVALIPCFEEPRKVTFFLPDDPDVKAVVDVPAREKPKEEKRLEKISRVPLFQKMREAYAAERAKTFVAPWVRIQRRRPLIDPFDLLPLYDFPRGG